MSHCTTPLNRDMPALILTSAALISRFDELSETVAEALIVMPEGENVIALPGAPEEMRTMFAAIRDELRRGPKLHTWRSVIKAHEHQLLPCLREVAERGPQSRIASA